MRHYGVYGENCVNTGQFDAGECTLCSMRRVLQDDTKKDQTKLDYFRILLERLD